MIGGSPISSIFGSLPDGEALSTVDGALAYGRALCDAGMAVLLLHPGTKEPADMRSPQKRGTDDRAAREEAREAGRPDWERARSASGLHLATSDKTTLDRYIRRYYEIHGEGTPINLAIEVGRSNLLVVDCDTPDQVSEFLEMCGAPADLPPTVRSPGKRVDGEWVHWDGGHFYFTVDPENPLPTEVGSLVIGESNIAVLWHNRYVLIPPSVREEGFYTLTGREYPVPAQLADLVGSRCEARRQVAERRRNADTDNELGDRIDQWAQQISWTDILAPLGWVPISAPDNCGCPMLTAPGDHSSPKSATAHDSGCSLGWWENNVNAPLHIWTSNPGEPFETWIRENGLQTVTKFQAVALTEYGGNMAQAMDALGIAPSLGVDIEGVNVSAIATEDADPSNLNEPEAVDNLTQLDGECEHEEVDRTSGLCTGCGDRIAPPQSPPTPDPVEYVDEGARNEDGDRIDIHREAEPAPLEFESMSLRELAGGSAEAEVNPEDGFPIVGEIDQSSGLYMPIQAGVPEMAPFRHWRDLPPPEYVVGGLLEHGGLTCIMGTPGAGKSTIALDIAAHIATGRSWQGRPVLKTKVLYLPGEGLAGVVQRLLAWEEARDTRVGEDLLLGNGIIQLGATREAWAELREFVARQQIGLIIFDTFARMATNIDENSATDVGKAIKRFDQVRELTHCGVLVVHHTGKASPDVARGSSALNGALDSELLVRTENERVLIPAANGNPESWGKAIHLRVTKQKNAEQTDDEIDLLMVNWHDRAPLITGPTGTIDPMQGEVLLARPVPEPLIETAVRIRAFVDRFTEQGCTRTDIAQGVLPDPYTQGLRYAERQWKLKVAEAVDRSLRWGLLDTFEGSSARYVSGPVGATAARQIAAEEVMVPDATL